ncbi:MAG TPA: substrate-binding domain-containing protein [Coleofasciculaceae cyanobacterium]
MVFVLGESSCLQAEEDVNSAAPQQMDNLAKKQLLVVETRQNLVKNQMVLVVPKGKRVIAGFTDLTQESIQQIALG